VIGEPTLRLIRFLSCDGFRSGQDVAAELGCSRAAVWKQVEALRALGIRVAARPGRGYRLDDPLELLDRRTMAQAVGRNDRWPPVDLEILPETDSTNAELLRLPPGRRHARAVLAEYQCQGRGRRGRRWHSPFGRNVYLSLGWEFGLGMAGLACLPLVVAVAAATALERVGLEGHGLKWPNDLELAGRKLGGCLVEVSGDVNGPCQAVMGIGINVFLAGEQGAGGIGQPWTDLGSHLPGVSRNAVAGHLLDRLVEAVARFEAEGFAPFRNTWERFDILAGRPVTLFQGATSLQGVARGVGPRGGLLLERAGEITEHLAGEVSSRPAGD